MKIPISLTTKLIYLVTVMNSFTMILLFVFIVPKPMDNLIFNFFFYNIVIFVNLYVCVYSYKYFDQTGGFSE